MTDQEFNRETRSQVLQTVIATVEQRLFDPSFNGKNWQQITAAKSESILGASEPADPLEAAPLS